MASFPLLHSFLYITIFIICLTRMLHPSNASPRPILTRRNRRDPRHVRRAIRSFTASELVARYELMVQYKHGQTSNCPVVWRYDGHAGEDNGTLLLSHSDIQIAAFNNSIPQTCSGNADATINLLSSTFLADTRLEEFEASIKNDMDKTTVFESIHSQLSRRVYLVSSASSHTPLSCGGFNWFEHSEMFVFFDEADTVMLSIVAKIQNGSPRILTLPLVGNIRYMLSVTSGTTCIYRVDTDVSQVLADKLRPSPSPLFSQSVNATETPNDLTEPSQSSSQNPNASTEISISPSPVGQESNETVVIPNPSPLPTPSASVSSEISPAASATASPLAVTVNVSTTGEGFPDMGQSMEVEPTADMSEDPYETSEEDGLDGIFSCFPRSATVLLADGSTKQIKDLRIGDSVQGGDGQFSTVILFTHRDSDVRSRFVRVTTEDKGVLVASAGHYVYINGKLSPMREIGVGDELQTIASRAHHSSNVQVIRVEEVWGKGLYNPQTMSGDIAVNGFKSSCYTEAVQLEKAHALLLPIRLLRRVTEMWALLVGQLPNGNWLRK